MIFQHTWKQVLDGTKTQTRRLVSENRVSDMELARDASEWPDLNVKIPKVISAVFDCLPDATLRCKWLVGRTYAVQPGRGKKGIYYKRTPHGLSVYDWDSLPKDRLPRNLKYLPGEYIPARIRITGIRQERVQDITTADAIAEGVPEQTATYTHPVYRSLSVAAYAKLWNAIHTKPGETWNDNPSVWVLEFELVR